MTEEIEIGPQPGPQTQFLSTPATVAIYGGAAGGGKTYSLLLDPLRDIECGGFRGLIFRRNTTQITNPGGLWDTARNLYSMCNGSLREHVLDCVFPSGMSMKFNHLEYEKDCYIYQGAQVPYIGFDELTHFLEPQFWYMFSRMRSMTGIPGRLRATCNPDPDSFVRGLIDWWIGPDGYPIPGRSGKIRYFLRIEDKIEWGNSRKELTEKYGKDHVPVSFTFIPAKLSDNKILMKSDPTYKSRIEVLQKVDRERLLGGNWNIRATAGNFFRREWFPIVDAIPGGWSEVVRSWDRAATKPNPSNNDPDWTRGIKLYRYANGTYVIGDLRSLRDTPGQVENLIRAVASHDGQSTKIVAQQDPGSAGVGEAETFVRMLPGYDVSVYKTGADKPTRAKPVSAQAEAGNIRVLRAPWNKEFFDELDSFPPPKNSGHDDIVDALSGAFYESINDVNMFDVFNKFAGMR